MVKVELFFTYYIPHIPPLIEQGSHLKTSLPGFFPFHEVGKVVVGRHLERNTQM